MAEDGPYWVLRANGGIHSTAYDMLRWARSLLEGRVLSPASMARLWTPHVREGEGADSSYGYGWVVMELEDGAEVVTHNGGNGIFFSDLALVPASGIAVYLQTNVAAGNPYVDDLLGRIGYRLAAGRPYPEVPEVVPADPERLAELAGEWTLAGGGRLRATAEDDALVVEPLDPAAFVRQGEPDGRLLGISGGGLPPRLRFRAEASGALAAWDPRSGGTTWLDSEGAGAGTRLRFGRGEQALEARRAEAGESESP
jgi:hypothetical protein